MKSHIWTWKTAPNGRFWVVCRECGTSDRAYDSMEEANRRVFILSAQETTKFSAKTGLSRKIRKNRALKRKMEQINAEVKLLPHRNVG